MACSQCNMKNKLLVAFVRFLATGLRFKLTAMMLQAAELQTCRYRVTQKKTGTFEKPNKN